jgi:hypothetical protein
MKMYQGQIQNQVLERDRVPRLVRSLWPLIVAVILLGIGWALLTGRLYPERHYLPVDYLVQEAPMFEPDYSMPILEGPGIRYVMDGAGGEIRRTI